MIKVGPAAAAQHTVVTVTVTVANHQAYTDALALGVSTVHARRFATQTALSSDARTEFTKRSIAVFALADAIGGTAFTDELVAGAAITVAIAFVVGVAVGTQ